MHLHNLKLSMNLRLFAVFVIKNEFDFSYNS